MFEDIVFCNAANNQHPSESDDGSILPVFVILPVYSPRAEDDAAIRLGLTRVIRSGQRPTVDPVVVSSLFRDRRTAPGRDFNTELTAPFSNTARIPSPDGRGGKRIFR